MHREGRWTDSRVILYPDARAWMEDRHSATVCDVAAFDGGWAFLILPLGIKLAGVNGMSAFSWLFWSYVLQKRRRIAHLSIGYAMIGKLAPKQYQGIMMGSWMLVTGLASLFAGDFSGMIPEPTGSDGGRH